MMLGLASIILVSLNILFYWSFIKQKESTQRVAESRLILQKLESILSTAKDAETGQRGYLLTGQEAYLEPYNSAVTTIKPQIEELKQLTQANPNQQKQFTTLEFLVTQKLTELQKTIDLKNTQGLDSAKTVILTHHGKKTMDQIRNIIREIQEDSNEQLQTWFRTREETVNRGHLTFSVGLFLNLMAFYLVYCAIVEETRERRQAEASLKQLNEELEDRVYRRTAQLKEANANLMYSNRELEQFAYVASHDLQEPLRAVNSYAQLLARKYQNNLDAKADKYLGYIMEGATRMQQLINDLLEFSRVGTQAKALQSTACEQVLNHVLKNLQIAIAEHQARVTHDPLPIIMGDEIQLIQLFQNFIGNALKFRRKEPPHVHISAVQRGDEWLFSVRDNGIGMESEYFERIFVIFQRLHSRQEYPGTGIGLAICKKIVERHGGQIWVESTLDVGTTFYFTIPKH
jgi:signal transduction histidine kinase